MEVSSAGIQGGETRWGVAGGHLEKGELATGSFIQ